MRVKICGITRYQDAEAAVSEGAIALGFILIRNSPRYIDADRVRAIVRDLPPFVTPVGVCAQITRSEALAMIAKAGVRSIQLHGDDETDEFGDFPVPVYRSFRVSPEFRLEILKRYKASAFMLDTYVYGALGGTGKTFDWNIAVAAKRYGRLILSGGINPDNVGDAIRRVSPYAIDVSSGVELSPGIKDHRKIRALFDAIREIEK